tara:strand:+ start:931 stop:1095 length:165 start_codon:yes stop_codon:yes gene_type:complete
MDNRYFVKIRLFDGLPEMPEHGKYKQFIVECSSLQELELLVDDKHKITMCEQLD